VTYLAVDFGTANCVASAAVGGEIKLVPLEGDSPYLPSVVFAPRIEPETFNFTSEEYERELAKARHDDSLRVERERKELDIRLERFSSLNGPHIDLPPRRSNYSSEQLFLRASEEYSVARRVYLRDLEQFRRTRLAEEMQNLSRFLRPPLTRNELDRVVKASLIRALGEKKNREYWNQSFMSILRRQGSTCLLGSEASRAYGADPLGGFFLRSPKAFLGTSLSDEWRDFFIQLISRMLRHIKMKAHDFVGEDFDGVLLGRPVNYLGAGGAGNLQALSIMRQAAADAGFLNVRFVCEPLAALMEIDRAELASYARFMLVDIGGGTTDAALVSLSAAQEFLVEGVAGRRVGGNDFDESLAWGLFTPLLGRGAELKSGLRMPGQLYADAVATRDAPAQIRFKNSGHKLLELVSEARDPVLMDRFLHVWENQLQHQLLVSAEEAKIGLSTYSPCEVALSYVEEGLAVEVTADEFLVSNSANLDRIGKVAQDCLADANIHGPLLVFITGGLSYSRATMLYLRERLPDGSQLATLPALSSVCMGLGAIAARLSKFSPPTEPDQIAGIPVER